MSPYKTIVGWLIGGSVCALLLSACTHTILRPIPCPPEPPLETQSVIGWRRVAGPKAIAGQVVVPGSLAPIAIAEVSLHRLPQDELRAATYRAVTNPAGSFKI